MDHKQALAHFPLELIETTGAQALAKWQELKSAGRGTPVVLGAEHFLQAAGARGQSHGE